MAHAKCKVKRVIMAFGICLIIFYGCGHNPSKDETTALPWWTSKDRDLVISELNRTTKAIRLELKDLKEDQWTFRESPDRWSILEIIEHLEMQNQLHYREISVISNTPQLLHFRTITEGKDAHFTKYATDTIAGTARWFLQPKGKFCTGTDAEKAFFKARSELTKLVELTSTDFRKQFTFRSPVGDKDIANLKIGEVRDLHQLLLTGIAHTDRHLKQLRNLKAHPKYPKSKVWH
ncbi:DinB family protein [Spongiimicrobium sp. 3-5]|uniref:DinB family protein n=1 Tax=Spongiimicrobium sp. 3-5 TaxID=3332596 RepID=UPI0039813F2D